MHCNPLLTELSNITLDWLKDLATGDVIESSLKTTLRRLTYPVDVLHLFFLSLSVTTYQFLGRDSRSTQNENSVRQIPAVARLLKGFRPSEKTLNNVTENNITKNYNCRNCFRRTTKRLLDKIKVSSPLKKFAQVLGHKLLKRIPVGVARSKYFSQTASKVILDGNAKRGSFRIFDKSVKGIGIYSISRDRKYIDLKLKLKINKKQHQQNRQRQRRPKQKQPMGKQRRPKQQQKLKQQKQQQIKTTANPVMSARFLPCLAPCDTRQLNKALNCLGIGKYENSFDFFLFLGISILS